jgi:hypothetical protein
LFLATPHQGSEYAKYAYILAKTANVLIVTSQLSRLVGKMRYDILRTLYEQAPEQLTISQEFRIQAEELRIVSFVEGMKLLGLNERVRYPTVATLDLIGLLNLSRLLMIRAHALVQRARK